MIKVLFGSILPSIMWTAGKLSMLYLIKTTAKIARNMISRSTWFSAKRYKWTKMSTWKKHYCMSYPSKLRRVKKTPRNAAITLTDPHIHIFERRLPSFPFPMTLSLGIYTSMRLSGLAGGHGMVKKDGADCSLCDNGAEPAGAYETSLFNGDRLRKAVASLCIIHVLTSLRMIIGGSEAVFRDTHPIGG